MLPDDEILSCPICYKIIIEPYKLSNCIHKFCKRCISIWKMTSNKCQICRLVFYKILKDNTQLPWVYK